MLNNRLSAYRIIFLQIIVLLYSISGVMAKAASGEVFMSLNFIVFYGLEITILGLYAILWQQIIKKIPLSIAYANRSLALLWSSLWAIVFFHETITVKNIIGVMIVVIGTVIINVENA